jgi:hypothetical protein
MERNACSGSAANKHEQSGRWKHAAKQQKLQLCSVNEGSVWLGCLQEPSIFARAPEVTGKTTKIKGSP